MLLRTRPERANGMNERVALELEKVRVNAVWHPFTQHGLGAPIPRISHAEGAALYINDGWRIIDAISSCWVTTHGHCHPRIMTAIAAQSGKLDQIIFAGWTHEPAETLAR
jgi:adenosylmethionine---8-amino-7-oxononanoate aminotransferase